MPADGTLIVKRYQKRKERRYNFDTRWEQMAPFLAPSRMGIITNYTQGEKQTRGVYDSTMLMAAEMMAHFFAGHIINPSQYWFNYIVRPPSSEKRFNSLIEWAEECRDLTLKRYASSLFYAEGPESLIDYGGFGTGFLMTEEAPQPVNKIIRGFRGFYFHAEKTGRFCIEEGADGLVDTADREFKISARLAKDTWGAMQGATLPENIKKANEEGQGDREFKIIHSIYPRPWTERGAGGKGMPWASCWVEMDSKHLIYESGYRTFPAAVPRYQKTPGEVYGRGRGDIAFPDTWTLNTAKKMGLEDWALKIRPPILTRSASVIGSLRLVPAGQTSVNTHGEPIRNSVMPYETGSHPEVSHLNEEELRRSIREIFYVEAIRQLLQVEKSEMTAFEFAKKIELLFRLLGPVYGRLEWEYLYRILDTSFTMQYEALAFPPPPPEIEETNGQVDITFQNPLAKAQRAGDVEALTIALQDLAPLIQIEGRLPDRLDPDDTVDGILELRGVPARWQRTDKEIAVLRAERQKQNELENRLALAEQAAGVVGKATPALKIAQGAPQ